MSERCRKTAQAAGRNKKASGTTARLLAERSAVKVRQTQVRRSSTEWTRAGRRHDEPLGVVAATSLAAVWHASLQVQREDGVQGTAQMLLGSHAVAGHGIPFVVVAVARQRLAGKLLAWRCRADSGNVHRSVLAWSERELWIQSPSMECCATRHPQARRNKCPQRRRAPRPVG